MCMKNEKNSNFKNAYSKNFKNIASPSFLVKIDWFVYIKFWKNALCILYKNIYTIYLVPTSAVKIFVDQNQSSLMLL